ncbi:MAG TPA: NACHT domain-containing protein, partial [Kouleothrix sp.]|nr:NACHT domain-containing protein [Kouleothrix sp.]
MLAATPPNAPEECMALDHDDQNDRPRFHQPNWAVGGDAYNVAGSVTNNYYPPATAPLSPQQQRDRRTMLAKVRAIWIDGLLDQSLAQALRVELGLTTQPGAVDLALPKLVQELNQPARELPAGTPISAVFGQVGGALLILGAPGAGKTTLLLELARDLLARAEADDAHPIPVVFNLSTWAANPTTLAAWLVDELSQRYDVPRKTAQQWIAADAVLPLLDGLDEVAAAQRNDCVVAINQYHNEQGFVPLAVCSRAGEYSELDYKLRL